MTISQALKEKNKRIAKLNKLWDRLHRSNSRLDGTDLAYHPVDLWKDINDETAALVELKTKIHVASQSVRSDIFSLSELKSTTQRLRSLDTTKGIVQPRYGTDTPMVMVCDFDTLWKDTNIEALENSIEELQEKLDQFNHTVHI
jgi:DNA repair exonuclease SbcCD ATPase subunit